MLVIRKGGAKGIAVLATADELPVIRTNGHEAHSSARSRTAA